MPRTITTFEGGNKFGLKLTPELAELFLATLRQTGRLSVSAGRCCVGPRTVRTWLAKGREENAEEPYKSFADDVERTRAEFLAVAARRMGQLAIGGTLTLPKYDKTNQLVRDADGEIEWEERYFPPNVNALAHVLDRIDPEPNLQPQQPELLGAPEQRDAEALAEAAQLFDLFSQSFKVMVELGMEPPAEWKKFAIATSATKVEPEPATVDVTPANEPEKESDPPPTPSAATIATTIEPDPSDKPPEAF